MAQTKQQIEAAAIGWLIRLRDGRTEDWEEFVRWLEASSAHAEIYEEVALADEVLGTLPKRVPRPPDLPAAQPPPVRKSRRGLLASALAAVLIGVIGYNALSPGEELMTVRTAPGERRSLALRDGSRIDLNGSTTLVIDLDEPRQARLTKGEALFTVVHDPSSPFGVEAGNAFIQDVGTVFNVIVGRDVVEVATAEGEVIFNPGHERVRLPAGTSLRKEGRRAVVTRTDPTTVGGWREARLSYSFAPYSKIAADLSRNLGVPVRVHPSIAGRSFSGVIVLDRDQERLFRRVSALLDVEGRRSGDGWLLMSEARTTR